MLAERKPGFCMGINSCPTRATGLNLIVSAISLSVDTQTNFAVKRGRLTGQGDN